MDKRKKLSIGNNLALCFIAVISIVISIGASSLFYYFEEYVNCAGMDSFYQVMKNSISVLFTITVLVLMVHMEYKVIGKTLFERMDMKKNPLLKKITYWVISTIVALVILYVFELFVEKFDKYFLFMILAILEICDIVASYMMDEYDVNNEELSLSYLLYSVMIALICYVVFSFSNVIIEPRISEGYKNSKEFYTVTKNILDKIESNNIVELKEYITKVDSIIDNDLVKEYAKMINGLPDVITDQQFNQLKGSISEICNEKDEVQIEQSYVNEKENLKKALTVEGLLLFFISLYAYVSSCMVKKYQKENKLKKEIKKTVSDAKKEVQKEVKKEVKKEAEKINETEKKVKVPAKAKAVKPVEKKKVETKKAAPKKAAKK
ncbi:MAG: hypothetical protein RR489_05675 [Clostridia bacterium]